MDFDKIKLVIWDLDETLWSGVLSDGTASVIERNFQLVRTLTDAGVINSVCSKNDLSEVKEFLINHKMWEYFVFCSVNWSQKGERVKEIITEMNLRAPNVLFIDDNPLNLAEVESCCEGIMTALPSVIEKLISHFEDCAKTDKEHKRLLQYKVLEAKKQFKATASSNEEFLHACNIQVEIKYDCVNELDRISELVARSNQLNFTKVRSRKEELLKLFEDDAIQSGYVQVKDNFGDYGIVGFFAIKDGVLEHFVFSCRTLNMGIEQYVYGILSRPKLTIVGEVASTPCGQMPDWINKSEPTKIRDKQSVGNTRILVKGPCDLSQVLSFIDHSGNITEEFVYVNDKGVSIESGGHTEHILQSLSINREDVLRLSRELPFGDEKMYETAMFDDDIGAVYLSMFTDANLGLYREKESNITVAFGEWTNDLTDKKTHSGYISGELFTSNAVFDTKTLEYISERFEFLGRITPEKTLENLDYIYSRLGDKTKLILNLGSETEYENNTKPAYEDRHIYHSRVNSLIRNWKKDKDRVYLIEATELIKSQKDYTNNINHFVKSIYYQMAQKLTEIINDGSLKTRKIQKMKFSRRIKKIIKRLLGRY